VSFIDDGLREREQREQSRALIAEHAPKIYSELWRQIVEHVAEAKKKGLHVFTNGSLHDRLVEMQDDGRTDHFRLVLDSTNRTITASGSRSLSFTFELTASPEGIVSLESAGEQISPGDAAVLILKQFLFGE
jgi:single-stranded DNA-binding protein